MTESVRAGARKVVPTPVGVNLGKPAERRHSRCRPHARGGEPDRGGYRRRAPAVVPTPVGVNLGIIGLRRWRGSRPHARGGEP